MKRKLTIAFCSFFLLISTACKTNSADSLIITDNICPPPCWHNIMPGKTTKQVLIGLLQSAPYIKTESIISRGASWKIFDDIIAFSLSTGEEGKVFITSDKVTLIIFTRKPGLSTFGKAIEKFGQPSYLTRMPIFGPGPSISSIIHNYYFVIYPELGIRFGYDDIDIPESLRTEIKPEIKISEIDYFDPANYEALLESSVFSEGMLNARETQKILQPWKGYGLVDTKYPIIPIE